MASIISEMAVVLIADDTGFIRGTSNASKSLETLALESELYKAKMADNMAIAGGRIEMQALKAEQATARMVELLDAQAALMGINWAKLGDQIALAGKGAALVLVGIAAYSIDAASKFQAAMELVHTQAGAGQQEVDLLGKSVLNLAGTVGIGPDKLAEGLYHIESAGFRGKEAMDILTMAAHNAATGMSDMEDASQAMVGTMAVGFKDVRDAADAAAYLNTIVGIGDMRMQQLSAAIATGVMPTFKEAGLGMTDFGAALATLTDNVTPANQAATRLRMTIALLGAPSKAAFEALKAVGIGAEEANNAFSHRDELAKYGVNVSQLSADLQKPDGLLVAVNDLKHHLETAGLTANEQAAVIEKAFGGGRTSAAIQTLLSESDRLASKYQALGDHASRAKQQQEAWAATQATFKQQTHELGASIQTMAIQLGSKLLPPLTQFFTFLTTHKAALYAFFGTLLVFLALLTTAFIIMGISAIAAEWPILLVLAAVALVAFGIYELVTHWSTVWKFIKEIAMDVWHWLVNVWHDTWRDIMSVVHWIKANIIDPIVNFFKGMAHGIMDAWRFLTEIPGFLKREVVDPVIRFVKMMVKWFEDQWHLLLVVVHWIVNNIFKPIADFAWNFMLLPIRIILDILIFLFKMAWGFISVVLTDFWNNVVKPVAHGIAELWDWAVKQIEKSLDFWMGVLKAIWNWIYTTFWVGALLPWLHEIAATWDWLVQQIKHAIDGWILIIRAVWSVMVATWHDIYNGFIAPLWAAISNLVYGQLQGAWNTLIAGLHGLRDVWNTVWSVAASALKGAWATIKGIFDLFMGGIHGIEDAFKSFEKTLKSFDPGKIGGAVASFFHFAEGGTVPGPKGKPMMAVVHGGEYVLNTDQVDAIQGASVTSMMAPTSGAVAIASGGGGGPSQIIVNVDGKKLFDIMVQRSQRNKSRNNSTFLT